MKPSKIRIIGGQWRSRLIDLIEDPGLRPTPDRVRETLFNWLSPVIEGARCLDLFAGSGALSFEALSRGASEVLCVEQARALITQIQCTAQLLQAAQLQIIHADAMKWLKAKQNHTKLHQSTQSNATLEQNTTALGPKIAPFDIIFLDPPYHLNLLPSCFALLEQGWLKPQAHIYFEHDQAINPEDLPKSWRLLHQKKAGYVHYGLVQN